MEFQSIEEAPGLLAEALKQEYTKGVFLQLVFYQASSKELLSLQEFLEVFRVPNSEQIVGKIEEKENTFFIYFSEQGPRFGLVARVKDKAGLESLLEEREAEFVNDFSGLLFTLAGESLNYSQSFKQANNGGSPFKYLDSDLANFGPCYSILGDYFLLTFSGETMVEVLKSLE